MENKTVRSVLSDFKVKECAQCVSKYCAENCGVVQKTEAEIRSIVIEELEKIINNPGYTIMPNGELKPNQIDLDTLKRVIAKVREGVK